MAEAKRVEVGSWMLDPVGHWVGTSGATEGCVSNIGDRGPMPRRSGAYFYTYPLD